MDDSNKAEFPKDAAEGLQAKMPEFDDVIAAIGSSLEAILPTITDTSDMAAAVSEIRDIASENNIGFSDAIIIAAVRHDPSLDARIADMGLRGIRMDEVLSLPDFVKEEDSDGLLLSDKLYDVIAIVADVIPDGKCAQVVDVVNMQSELDAARRDLEDQYDADMAEVSEEYPDEAIDVEQQYMHGMEDLQDEIEALDDKIANIHQGILKDVGGGADSEESGLVSDLLRADAAHIDAQDTEKAAKAYLAEHPDSAVAAVLEARTEYKDLLDTVSAVSGDEKKQALLESFYHYRDVCGTVMFGAPAGGAVDKKETDFKQDTDKVKGERLDTDPIIGKFDLSKHSYSDLPVGIREDAASVVAYGAAERIYAHADEYKGFSWDDSLLSMVYDRRDTIEAIAAENHPLSRELAAILNEIDALRGGPQDDAVKGRLEFLEGRKEDLITFAGAVVHGTRSAMDLEQDKAITDFQKVDMDIRRQGTAPTQEQFEMLSWCKEDLAKFSQPEAHSRDGVAARYLVDVQRRDAADLDVRRAETYYKTHPDAASERVLNDYVFTRDNIQRQLDDEYYKIIITEEGSEAYGKIDSPVTEDLKEAVEAIPFETVPPLQEDTKSEYDIAKEKYEQIKDKYLFRNTFVCYARLTYDIEAYKAEEKGSNGRYVSGGDIAMDVLNFMRSNVIESVVEVGLRYLFDTLYPAVDKNEADVTTAEDDKIYVKHTGPDESTVERNYAGTARDNGVVTENFDKNIEKTQNPGTGHYMGADMTKEWKRDDFGSKVYLCGKKVDFTATTGRVDANGEMEIIKVPPIRLVVVGESKYLVDPFGKTLHSNIVTSAVSDQQNDNIAKPYFRDLDISAGPKGALRIESLAEHRGQTVDECKADISKQAMENYISRGVVQIEAHEKYIKDKLLPEALEGQSVCRERIEYLEGIKNVFVDKIENPPPYQTEKDTAAFSSFIPYLDSQIEKLKDLEAGFSARVEKLVETIKMYDETKIVCENTKDVEVRFGSVMRADTEAGGKIDKPYYGISTSDLESIDRLLGTCGFDKKEELTSVFADKGWPTEVNVSYSWLGVKSDYIPNVFRMEHKEMRAEIKAYVSAMFPDYSDRWPGLTSYDDRDFEVKLSDARVNSILIETGFLSVDRSEVAAEFRAGVTDEVSKMEHLGMYKEPFRILTPEELKEREESQIIRPVLTDIPTPEQIEQARDLIRDNSYGSVSADGYGTRQLTPDFDWSTAAPREIIQDGDAFWVRPDGAPEHVKMTIDQTAAYLHGPLEKQDVSAALDKYLAVADHTDSSYDFTTDFLDINKYRVTPDVVLEAYADKLKEFVSGSDKSDVSPRSVEIMADCFASAKEQIVSCYADAVADKLEKIISDVIDKYDNDRVSLFVDKVADSFEGVVSKVKEMDIDPSAIKLRDSVVEKLDALNEQGVSKEDIAKLTDIAKALDAVFDGYSKMLTDSVEAFVDRNRDDVERDTDKADIDEADKKDDDAAILVEDIEDTVKDVVSGLDAVENYDPDSAEDNADHAEDTAQDDNDDIERDDSEVDMKDADFDAPFETDDDDKDPVG